MTTDRPAVLSELPERWRTLAAQLEPYNAGAARAFLACAEQAETALRLAADEVLSLDEAAAASGYSADWLGRQVAAGAIPNAGRKHKPAIRRADLPRKAGHPLPTAPNAGQTAGRRRIVLDARPQH